MSKPWYLSRTIWINAAAGLVEILAIVSTFPGSEKLAMYLPPITAIINIFVRRLTSEPITGSAADPMAPSNPSNQ